MKTIALGQPGWTLGYFEAPRYWEDFVARIGETADRVLSGQRQHGWVLVEGRWNLGGVAFSALSECPESCGYEDTEIGAQEIHAGNHPPNIAYQGLEIRWYKHYRRCLEINHPPDPLVDRLIYENILNALERSQQ